MPVFLPQVLASRRRRVIVAVGLAGVLAISGGWMLGRDAGDTRVSTGSGDVAAALPDETMALSPGDEAGAIAPSSTTTGPQSSPSTAPKPTTTSVAPPETTTSSTTASTTPLVPVDTVQSPVDAPCSAPRTALVHHNVPVAPTASDWRTVPAAPIAARMRHGSVWTGREMVVWGGSNGDISNGWREFNDGAAYNPATGAWRVLPPAPLAARTMPPLVWTGHEVVVAGVGTLDSAAYDPATNCWRTIADSPLGYSTLGFGAVTAAWTGDRVLAWNGTEGATWDPASDRWERIAPPPGSACARPGDWADGRLFVWWRADGSCGIGPSTGAVYDPATKGWTPISVEQNAVLAGFPGPGVWTGSELLLPGFTGAPTSTTTWFAFDPDTAGWRTVAQPSNWVPWQTAVWTGAEMVVWGGYPDGPNAASAYDPLTDEWRSAGNAPFSGRHGHTAVWTGTEMIIWGGQGSMPAHGDGAAYRPT